MTFPTVFHVTHWKAGSQWVRGVLNDAVPDRIVELKDDMSHVTEEPIRPGGVYTPVYLARDDIAKTVSLQHARVFVVFRDPRDVLVSWYFSLRHSHGDQWSFVAEQRRILEGLSKEDGLLHVMHGPLWSIFRIQESWLESGALLLRYEEMLADEQGAYEQIFRHCALDMPEDQRRSLVEQHSFAKVTGRRPGEEDASQHHRKGVAGDWRLHLTDRVKDAFKERFGAQLIRVGYAADDAW